MRRPLAALALGGLLVAGGCRVESQVSVTVEDDGSGEVEVLVALDEEALARIPDLDDLLVVDDLEATGWEVGELEPTDDGATITASRPFASPDQLGDVLAEVAGQEGLFGDLLLTRSHRFGQTEWRLQGEVDASAGLAGLSDAELAELLGGEPLGFDLDALAEELGQPVDELYEWVLRVRFVEADAIDAEPPGEAHRAPTGGGEEAAWSGTLADDEPVPVEATASRTEVRTLVAAAVAAVAVLALLVLLVVRAIRARRRRRRAADDEPAAA